MNRLSRIFLLIIALGCVVAANRWPATTVAQQTPTTITIAGLHERVTVRRDERGIPYIEAANNDDLYFAQGYITATDRLRQMDLLRRNVRGELAEIFGEGALGEDKRHRTFGFAQVVDETAKHLPSNLNAAMTAYASGVNAFSDSLTDQTTPIEFRILQYKPRHWTPADSLAVGKLLAEYLSNSWQLDVMRGALMSLPKEKRDALLPEASALDVIVVGSDQRTSSAGSAGILPAVSSKAAKASPLPSSPTLDLALLDQLSASL